MAKAVLIIGEPGSGKSTSIRNLNPKETFLINVLNKTLPFRGSKALYRPFDRTTREGNYIAVDDYTMITKIIKYIEATPSIKNLVLDDFQYLMAHEFLNRCMERGYDKFSEIALHAHTLLKNIINSRDDLTCFILSHSDESANGKVKCKTIGKLLEEKISIDGMFTEIMHALVVDGKHQFLTQNNGTYMARSPMGMFDSLYIDNDLMLVKEAMDKYMMEEKQFEEAYAKAANH